MVGHSRSDHFFIYQNVTVELVFGYLLCFYARLGWSVRWYWLFSRQNNLRHRFGNKHIASLLIRRSECLKVCRINGLIWKWCCWIECDGKNHWNVLLRQWWWFVLNRRIAKVQFSNNKYQTAHIEKPVQL